MQLSFLLLYCWVAASRGLPTFSKSASDAFVTKSYNNWKKAKEEFQELKQSHAHSEACVKMDKSHSSSPIENLYNNKE